MAKTRSPNYPALSLPEAIEKARMIYSKDFLNEMPSAVATEHMGYSGLNGASLTVLSALKKYGLMEGRGDSTRLTRAAQIVIENMPGADDTINELAFNPSLWNEICQHFDGEVPSGSNLRAFLLKRGFNPRKVDAVAKDYIATVEFTRTPGSGYTPPAGQAPVRALPSGEKPVKATDSKEIWSQPNQLGSSMVFPMGADFVATITFTGQVTQKRLNKLISFVELAKDEYPEDTHREGEASDD